jgi:hypothetical protein
VNDVSRELGGALGIAVLGSVMNGAYRSGVAAATTNLPPATAESATSSLTAAQQIGRELGAQGQQLVLHAQSAFVDGLGHSLLVGALALLLGAVFVALRAPGRTESKAAVSAAPVASVTPAEAA